MSRALAIDIGSSAVRAAIWDEAGTELRSERTPYRFDIGDDGSVDVEAGRLLGLVADVVDAVITNQSQVDCVGVSCFWHSLLGVAANGTPTTRVLTWADTRAARAATYLASRIDASETHQRTGAPLHASYLPAKLAFLGESAPSIVRDTRLWMSFGEYLALELFGTTRASLSMASGTGLLNRGTLEWDGQLLDELGIDPVQLSPISDKPLGGLREPWASRWPSLARVPWSPAFGDGACATVGSGCGDGARLALTIGTSAALRTAVDSSPATLPRGLWSYRIDSKRELIGGALNEGGGMMLWLRELVGLGVDVETDRRVAARSPDAHGLTILPFAAGERSPGWMDDARMTIHGLGLSTTPIDILRAALESVAYRLRLIADQLATVVLLPPGIVGTGGALVGSPAWAAILADVLGLPLTVSDQAEASCRGAAILALEAIGVPVDESVARPAGTETVEPDLTRTRTYQDAIARQSSLYAKIIGGV